MADAEPGATAPARPRAHADPRPWAWALGLWLLLAAAAGLVLWQLRQADIESHGRELATLSLALTDEIDRGLRGAEEGLQAMRAELHSSRLPVAGPEATAALHTRAELMPLVRSLWLLDANGSLLSASDSSAPPPPTGYAPPLNGLSIGAIAVSRPFVDAGDGTTLLALALRVDTVPGAVPGGGWIIAAVPASTLLGAFAAALPAADARVYVFRGDGALLSSANAPPLKLDEGARAQRFNGRPGLERRRFRDGSEKLVGQHRLARYDIQVVVSRDLEAVLSGWRGAAALTAAGFAALLGVVMLALHRVQRAELRRREAQQALQAQRARAGRLESLGTLAGGVAHDFNNVLAGIVGWGEMAQDAAVPGSAQARHIDKLLQAALRGKALVERVLSFSRGGARASTVFELQPLVDEALALLSGTVRAGVRVERGLAAAGGRLRGDPTQAFEAVMNLCTNALQAMPHGGVLRVELERVAVPAPRVLSHSQLAPGRYLALRVADQGPGITPAIMEHLFEPFFTTRAAESGTGLGLAVVHGVVAEFGGAIDVQNAEGHGARFTLYLPECGDALAPAPAAPAEMPAGQGQKLLVIDDEPELVALALEMLRGLGYVPDGCGDALAALDALRARPQAYAAVLTDEAMPGLTGTQLTAALRPHAPRLPVLLVSGWGGAQLAQRASAAGVTRLLAKPLQRAELARALAEVLQ